MPTSIKLEPVLVARASITFKAYDYDNFGAPELSQVIELDECCKLLWG